MAWFSLIPYAVYHLPFRADKRKQTLLNSYGLCRAIRACADPRQAPEGEHRQPGENDRLRRVHPEPSRTRSTLPHQLPCRVVRPYQSEESQVPNDMNRNAGQNGIGQAGDRTKRYPDQKVHQELGPEQTMAQVRA